MKKSIFWFRRDLRLEDNIGLFQALSQPNTVQPIFIFDEAILDPLAKGYNKLPDPIKTGTSNFTSNIGTLLSIPNNILQGNFQQLGHSVGSFVVNTSVGILGFLNPAEKMGGAKSK